MIDTNKIHRAATELSVAGMLLGNSTGKAMATRAERLHLLVAIFNIVAAQSYDVNKTTPELTQLYDHLEAAVDAAKAIRESGDDDQEAPWQAFDEAVAHFAEQVVTEWEGFGFPMKQLNIPTDEQTFSWKGVKAILNIN